MGLPTTCFRSPWPQRIDHEVPFAPIRTNSSEVAPHFWIPLVPFHTRKVGTSQSPHSCSSQQLKRFL